MKFKDTLKEAIKIGSAQSSGKRSLGFRTLIWYSGEDEPDANEIESILKTGMKKKKGFKIHDVDVKMN